MVDAVGMAGGMGRVRGPTLAERAELVVRSEPAPGQDVAAADRRIDRRAVVTRHCWVTGLPDCPGRWPGLLVEWRREPDTCRWSGRVVYCVDEASCGVLVETWVDAAHLAPA